MSAIVFSKSSASFFALSNEDAWTILTSFMFADFSKINEIYATFFKEPYPARSCVEVARLPKDVLIEIEAVAEKY